MSSAKRSKSTNVKNGRESAEIASGGGFDGEDDNLIACEDEAAETALYANIRCCEEELPFN